MDKWDIEDSWDEEDIWPTPDKMPMRDIPLKIRLQDITDIPLPSDKGAEGGVS